MKAGGAWLRRRAAGWRKRQGRRSLAGVRAAHRDSVPAAALQLKPISLGATRMAPWHVSLFAMLALLQRPHQGHHTAYDGRWWRSIAHEEQIGFVEGFGDCYKWDYRHDAPFQDRSFQAIADLVTAGLDHDSARLSTPVATLLLDTSPGPRPEPGGEVWSNPHGYFDGQFWREAGAAGRLGFVEGYVDCRVRFVRGAAARFSRPAPQYTALISAWYGINDSTDAQDEHRASATIASVLLRFRDRVGTRVAPN